MIFAENANELSNLLQDLGAADRNAVLLVIGTTVAAVVGRLLVALLLALFKALALAAVVAVSLWFGVQALGHAETAERVVPPTVEMPTMGPLAPE